MWPAIIMFKIKFNKGLGIEDKHFVGKNSYTIAKSERALT